MANKTTDLSSALIEGLRIAIRSEDAITSHDLLDRYTATICGTPMRTYATYDPGTSVIIGPRKTGKSSLLLACVFHDVIRHFEHFPDDATISVIFHVLRQFSGATLERLYAIHNALPVHINERVQIVVRFGILRTAGEDLDHILCENTLHTDCCLLLPPRDPRRDGVFDDVHGSGKIYYYLDDLRFNCCVTPADPDRWLRTWLNGMGNMKERLACFRAAETETI